MHIKVDTVLTGTKSCFPLKIYFETRQNYFMMEQERKVSLNIKVKNGGIHCMNGLGAIFVISP